MKKQLRMLELEEIEAFNSSTENNLSAEERAKRKKHLLNKRILLEHAQVDLWEEMMLPEHDSFTEYLFAVTQFAYVCCFSVVLPITPIIVLINHLLNMRLDAFKLCRGRRRPLAVQTGGIGVWNHVLHIVTVIAILTNCALMALTTSQLSWLATKLGKLGVFALSIGVEHFLLLVKYIMQLSVSRLPSSVENEMKKKKYGQEQKRYRSLRMKKRSKSSFGTKDSGDDGHHNGNPDNSGDILKTNPIPPIQESSSDVSELTPLLRGETAQGVAPERKKIVTSLSKRGGLVNVRALEHHSPMQHESKLRSPTALDTGKTRRNKHSRESARSVDCDENADPNFDEATQHPEFNLLQDDSKKAETQPNHKSSFHLDSCSSIDTHSSKIWRPSENQNAFSPDSSISTLPTPCHLHLESPDSEYKYYQYASAPPMSPEDDGNETIDLTDDDHNVPKAKWAVYHSFQYNKSAQNDLRKKSH